MKKLWPRVINIKEVLEEELALVENYISFLDRRRTGGILYIPEEMTLADETADGESLEEVLFEAMFQAVRDRSHPAAVIPIILRGPADLYDKVKHTNVDQEFYDTLCARAYKLKAQIEELDTDE